MTRPGRRLQDACPESQPGQGSSGKDKTQGSNAERQPHKVISGGETAIFKLWYMLGREKCGLLCVLMSGIYFRAAESLESLVFGDSVNFGSSKVAERGLECSQQKLI